MAIRISACYITKNEEKTLARSLAKLKGQVDEIIVADTGSTDRTVEVAQKYGARLYRYEWNDDFAAARNFALSKAQGDWIVFLDADEYFSFSSAKKLRKIIEETESDAIAVALQNIEEKTGKREAGSVVLRLWKNKIQRRYKGKIHEYLCEGDNNLCHVQYCPELMLYHTGYSDEIMQEKTERNLRLLLKEQAAGNATPFFARYLAQSYYMLHDYRQALLYAQKAIREEPPSLDSKAEIYRVACVAMRKLHVPLAERKETLEYIIMKSKPESSSYCSAGGNMDEKEKWIVLLQWAWEIGAMRAYVCAAIVLARDYQWKADDIANILLQLQNKTKEKAKNCLKARFSDEEVEKADVQGEKLRDLWQMLTISKHEDSLQAERWQLMLCELAITD